MQVGIDWVSLGIFLVAYVISQIRTVPLRVRYAVLSVALGIIAVYRLRLSAVGINLVFSGIAAALCLFYAYRAVKAGPAQR